MVTRVYDRTKSSVPGRDTRLTWGHLIKLQAYLTQQFRERAFKKTDGDDKAGPMITIEMMCTILGIQQNVWDQNVRRAANATKPIEDVGLAMLVRLYYDHPFMAWQYVSPHEIHEKLGGAYRYFGRMFGREDGSAHRWITGGAKGRPSPTISRLMVHFTELVAAETMKIEESLVKKEAKGRTITTQDFTECSMKALENVREYWENLARNEWEPHMDGEDPFGSSRRKSDSQLEAQAQALKIAKRPAKKKPAPAVKAPVARKKAASKKAAAKKKPAAKKKAAAKKSAKKG